MTSQDVGLNESQTVTDVIRQAAGKKIEDVGLDEVTEVSETIYKKTGNAEATLIWGAILEKDENETEESQANFDKPKGYFRVSLIATDFQDDEAPKKEAEEETVEDNGEQNKNEPENTGKSEVNREDKNRSGQGEYIVPSFFEQNLE